ncbi:MAG: GNAT family N-acetyltransferase [Chloroflexi bacterium]|nr:GNAT family N-acetyltransferase [Chloroflexota bacterium]
MVSTGECVTTIITMAFCAPSGKGKGSMYALTNLRTKRLLLRPFTFKDAADVLAYASDPEWSRFLPVPNPYTLYDAEEFIAKSILSSRDQEHGLAIELGGRVIGGIGLRLEQPIAVGSLPYSLAHDHWNQGLTTDAAHAVIDWGFTDFGLEKVYSWADVENVGSWRVMEKIGMTREGTFRSHGVNRGMRQDFHYYGILRSEWKALNA